MKPRLALLALLLTLLGTTVAVPRQAGAASRPAAPTAAATPSNGTTPVNTLTAVPVSGTYGSGQGKKSGAFKGLLYVQSFANQGGKLVALGKISGVMTNPGGQVFKTVTNAPVTLPISTITAGGAGNASGTSSGSAMDPGARGAEAHVAAVGCQILNLNLGPLNLNLLGLQVTLNRVILNITAIPGAGNLLGNLLCGVANLLNGGLSLGSLAGLLNGILQILRPTSVASPFANIPLVGTTGAVTSTTGVTGTPTPGAGVGGAALQSLGDRLPGATGGNGAFVGLFTIKQIVKNAAGDGLLAQGTVTGVFGNGQNGTVQDVSIPVTPTTSAGSSATPTPGSGAMAPDALPTEPMTAGCQILYLNLAPTSLNLLGLQVNLSRVVLTITAIPGAGNLLGNLLCAVANLLNGAGIAPAASARPAMAPGAPLDRRARRASSVDYDKLASALNALLNAYTGTISQPLAAIPVTGTSRGHGAFTGLLDVQSFAVQNGKVMAAGVLSGVLSGAGSKSGLVQQSVMVPVSSGIPGASTGSGSGAGAVSPQGLAEARVAASCSILHLVLGPLNLNLLGLQVTLNRVVLNITAQQGAGNLLGNLLCALTGLLNGGALSGLQNLLNGLQTLLTLFA